ncbi:MAG: DNA polymerase III subunit chi [Magnetococcales bacterium]|nr:DNA polymerase III subunit chi [Magnetococcales bacterium]
MARKDPGATVVRFYQMPREGMERGLFNLLGKIYAQAIRSCLVAADATQAVRWDDLLWTGRIDSFLPHGSCVGDDASVHPILLCLEPSDINGATLLILVHGRFAEEFSRFDMVLDFVTDQTPAGLQSSRDRYRRYRDAGCRMEYWIQEPSSGWQCKFKSPETILREG